MYSTIVPKEHNNNKNNNNNSKTDVNRAKAHLTITCPKQQQNTRLMRLYIMIKSVFFSSLTSLNTLRTSSTTCIYYTGTNFRKVKIRAQVNKDTCFLRKRFIKIYWFAFSRLSLLSAWKF